MSKDDLKIRSLAILSKGELLNAQEQWVEFVLDVADNHLQRFGKTLDDFTEQEQQKIILIICKQIVALRIDE